MPTPVIPEILLPPNLDTKSSTDELTISYRWRALIHFIVAIFALLCNGFNMYIIFLHTVLGVPATGENLMALGLCLLVGLGIAYYVLAGFINRTTIRVTPDHLQISYGPLPYFGGITVQTEDINQIYVAEIFTKSGKGPGHYSYELRARLNSGLKDKKLLKDLNTPLNALYLEQEIEHYLGIEDTTVPQEKRKTADQKEYAVRSWQALAQALNLEFVAGKHLETTSVSGTYNNHTVGLSAFRKDYPRGVLHTRLGLAANSLQAKTYPTPQNVVLLMNQISETLEAEEPDHMKSKITGSGQEIAYEQPGIETRAKSLLYLFDSFGPLLDAYPYMASLGGEAIVALKPVATDKTHRLKSLTGQWIEDIARQTDQLQNHASQLVCQLCMVRCAAHKVELSTLNSVSFFGCRECFQSQDFYEADHIVAVLDTLMDDVSQDGNTLRINWLRHGTLFDFDSVEIIRATDEDVERFIVQVGNDTLPARAATYKNMHCTLSDTYHLSENTLRILNKTFGHVKEKSHLDRY